MTLISNPMPITVNSNITIEAVIFSDNALILYSESDSGIIVHGSWPHQDAITNLDNYIECVIKLNSLTGLPKSSAIHMFFNVKEWDMAITEYQDLRPMYQLYVHGISETQTIIRNYPGSIVERLFKTSSNFPIYFRDFTISYLAETPSNMSDSGVFELDGGGPVHFEKITLQGNFNAGLISHLSNAHGQGDASTITNMRIFAYIGYGRTGSLVIDRGTKFGEIKQLQTSNRNYAIRINQTSHPFKVQALINDCGGVDIGGENAVYDLNWGTDIPAFIHFRANNSVLNFNPPNAINVLQNIGMGNTINVVKDDPDKSADPEPLVPLP